MFSLRGFLMQGFKDAVGKMADYQIILNATGYYEKNILLQEDLEELERLIEEKNQIPEIITTDETANIEDTESIESEE